MKTSFLLVAGAALCVQVQAGPEAARPDPLRRVAPVSFANVQIDDAFWSPRRATNRLVSIPVNFENLEKAGNLENFRRAARRETTGYQGPVFMDSDAHKALEAASYSLATDPDPVLERKLDEIIAILEAAQMPDGYLNSYYTVKEPNRRWVNLRDNHELYCAGHLIEAAVAHHEATGKRSLLNVARRLADNIDSVFGPPPKRMGYPGHPEIELALVKLARVTGEARYMNLARFFVLERGRGFFAAEHRVPADRYDGSYWQDDMPICEHRSIKGHAVRAAYLMSGATDVAVAAERGDPQANDLLRMLNRVWRNTTERNMYVTGGIGPSAHNEGFTVDYDLPNLTAYQETCASVALAQWAHRMALAYGDARYADVMERSLYNGALAGVSLDGERFFYVNPLASEGRHHRSPWFGCACCPPNIARTLASIGGYAYGLGANDEVYVNLYIQGSVRLALSSGREARLRVVTRYPWDGKVTLRWEFQGDPIEATLLARVPGWSREARWALNGKSDLGPIQNAQERGYARVRREWRNGDELALEFPMPVERVLANPKVKENKGLAALQRGPIVYCLEGADHPEGLDGMRIPMESAFRAEFEPDLLGGVVALRGEGLIDPPRDWRRRLYQAAPRPTPVSVTAIPYYAWDNRAPGQMRVWMPVAPVEKPALGLEGTARVTLSFTSPNCQPEAIHDGKEPLGSRQHPGALCHWWPHKGTSEWAQYSWDSPVTLSGARVYWFDDTGAGECRLPASWSLSWLDGDAWKPVATRDAYGVALDQWHEVSFEPVTTTALRLNVRLKDGWAAGVHEWQVIESDDSALP
jgi:DUF1680 family protein